MSKLIPRQVAAAVIVREGLVMIARRAPGQNLAGYWEFPGGKLEDGESPQHCIVRELAEELGVKVAGGSIIIESCFEYPGGAINLIAVETELLGGEIKLTVHDQLEWLAPQHLLELALAPADIPIVEELIRRSSADTAVEEESRR